MPAVKLDDNLVVSCRIFDAKHSPVARLTVMYDVDVEFPVEGGVAKRRGSSRAMAMAWNFVSWDLYS